MSEQVGELIGIFIRIAVLSVITMSFLNAFWGIESALKNIAETQNKITSSSSLCELILQQEVNR